MIESPPELADTSRRPAPVWVRRPELIALGLAFFLPPTLAWVDFLARGLPATAGNFDPANPRGPHQFPAWIRGWHYLNLLLVVLLARSGWRIFRAAPRLRWREAGARPAEWARVACRSGRGDDDEAGPGRYWHALLAVAWAASGWIYVGLVAATDGWEHVAPTTWRTVPEAWHVFVQYSTFHLPLDPDGYWRYNSLQLLSYFTVMFGIVPLICLTGVATSPAFGAPGRLVARLFGNREAARSVHALAILGYCAFLAVHVGFVVLYACWLDLDHVVLGSDESGLPGGAIAAAGVGGIASVVLLTRRRAGRRREA